MNLSEIISCFAAALIGISTLIGLIVPLVKAIKSGNTQMIKNALNSAAKEAVIFAENIKGVGGETKKQVALSKINQSLIEQKIKYNPEKAEEAIESFINLSKQVNFKESNNVSDTVNNTNISVNEEEKQIKTSWTKNI